MSASMLKVDDCLDRVDHFMFDNGTQIGIPGNIAYICTCSYLVTNCDSSQFEMDELHRTKVHHLLLLRNSVLCSFFSFITVENRNEDLSLHKNAPQQQKQRPINSKRLRVYIMLIHVK